MRATMLTWLKVIVNTATLIFCSQCNQVKRLINRIVPIFNQFNSCLWPIAARCWNLPLFRFDGEIKAQLKKEPNWKKLKTPELWCLQRNSFHHSLTIPCTNLSVPRSGTRQLRCCNYSLFEINELTQLFTRNSWDRAASSVSLCCLWPNVCSYFIEKKNDIYPGNS